MKIHIPVLHVLIIIALSPAFATTNAYGEVVDESVSTEYQAVRVVRITGELEHPWSLAFLPDEGFLVTERPGRLNRVAPDGSITRISGVPEVFAAGQGGLLDVAIHPDFKNNARVYLTYSKGDAEATATTLARGRLDGDTLVNLEDIFTQDRRSRPGRHYGSRLAWLPDGTLLMSIGDRGAEPPRAQDLADHAGSLIRLNDDGSVPDDNPFLDREDALPEIYSFGHRNIQGLIVHPETGHIWAIEHGPRGGDELNLIIAGANYGWPLVSRGRDYRTQQPYFDYTQRTHPDMLDPIIDWTPSLAVSGLAVLPSDTVYAAQWSGNFLVGALRMQQIRRVVFERGEPVHEEELLRGMIGRVRDVRIGPDGLIYVLTDESDGGLYRIEPVE